MTANPNSNLIFDFPDPTPNFDFNDSPTKPSTPVKKGKRFGKKFGSIKSGKAINNESPQSVSSSFGTGTTSSLNDSWNSTSLRMSDLGGSTGENSSCGDIAAGPSSPQTPGGSSSPRGSQTSFSLDSAPARLNLPRPLPAHGRNQSSSAHSHASGYISEASEFSFDRVTVATDETGATRGSNVSWGFLDEALVAGMGGGQRSPGGGAAAGAGFVPYTGSDAGAAPPSGSVDGGARAERQFEHAPKISSSTFDNVSLSDDETDNIPFTGLHKHYNGSGNQSVISEISERTGDQQGNNGAPPGGSERAIRALLREGMESARIKSLQDQQSASKSGSRPSKSASGEERSGSPSGRGTRAAAESSGPVDSPAPNGNEDDCQQETITSSRTNNNLLEDIQTTYNTFKSTRSNGHNDGKSSSFLHSIMEDIQFCGLYFCGIDTTAQDDENGLKYSEERKKKKEERKQAADQTFLGQFVQCGNQVTCGGKEGFCEAV